MEKINNEENQSIKTAPIVKLTNGKNIGIFLISIVAVIININLLTLSLKYGDSIVINILLVIVCGIAILTSLTNIIKSFYKVKCPYCNQDTLFPVGEQGANCTCCEKRIIIIDDMVRKIEETEK